jgi:GGDEF domain-containing protein
MMDPTGKPGPKMRIHNPRDASMALLGGTQPPWRTWCADSREDAVTGLVAFPDFHKRIPAHATATLRGEGLVGLAIGDVDGLKSYVERVNATDPDCYGHLAGNKVMTRLGAVTRRWFHEQVWRSGCVATFGGDEVIVAAALDDAVDFYRSILLLSDRLADALPVPVSFALALASADNLPAERSGGWQGLFMDRLLTTVDRCLFLHKAARLACGGEGGTSVVTELPLPGHRATPRDHRTLLPLPTASEALHVLAHPAGPDALGMLLLPCSGPATPSGSPLRITFPDGTVRTTYPASLHGQAAVRHETALFAGPSLPLTLRLMCEESSH